MCIASTFALLANACSYRRIRMPSSASPQASPIKAFLKLRRVVPQATLRITWACTARLRCARLNLYVRGAAGR